MTTYTATYSPEDNKLRLYASTRLDRETYDRVRAAGFIWAPKQDLFVAPMWTPAREDLLVELAGDIEDEDKSLVDRAEDRADRFEDYSGKRAADAKSAREAVAAVADGIPLGQPILVGHHSERRARKDAERIENGMRKACRLWETSKYWKARAAGAIRHAKYKELPAVRARRIKGLEADKRKQERAKADAERAIKIWETLHEEGRLNKKDGTPSTFLERAVFIAGRTQTTRFGAYSDLKDGKVTPEAVQAETLEMQRRTIADAERWISHISNRLDYEKAMLDEAGASELLAPKPKKEQAPLLNYRAKAGSITAPNMYHRGEFITYPQVEMTKAEYSAINKDYKGTRDSTDKSHRFRTAMVRSRLVCVFLTDSKAHEEPKAGERPQTPDENLIAKAAARLNAAAKPKAEPTEEDSAFAAMGAALKAGVQVVAAPQLFPTPDDLAARVVELADVQPGQRVLEPSAGTGALISKIIGRFTGLDCGRVVAVEINEKLCDKLSEDRNRRLYANDANFKIIRGDFLECENDLGTFDRIVMNPPFADGADIKHIMHAKRFLKLGGRLVAICANGPRQQEKLKPLATEWHDLPAGSFKASGTNVNAALVVIQK